jgi:lysophospholipid acyltransferase (LPLAT)-like uncharacterized protein
MFQRAADFFLGFALTWSYWLYSRLWFIEHINRPTLEAPFINAHWHGDELLLVAVFAKRHYAVMVSRSKDGEWMKAVLTRLGFHVVRGSSTRGGAAGLKGLIDAVAKEGLCAALAVDGPRGPVYQVKPGVLKLAQATGRPILMGAAAVNRRFVFRKAWNQCYLPLPFARAVIVYGEPLTVPPDASESELEQLRKQLEAKLISLKVLAESHFKRRFASPSPTVSVFSTSGV